MTVIGASILCVDKFLQERSFSFGLTLNFATVDGRKHSRAEGV